MAWNPTPIERLQHELEGAQEEINELRYIVDRFREAILTESPHESDAAMDDAVDALRAYDGVDEPLEQALCADCGIDTVSDDPEQPHEYYMIQHHLWDSLVADQPARFLCIGCVEYRLGRRLTAADFTDAPVNDPDKGWMSGRLRERMTVTA